MFTNPIINEDIESIVSHSLPWNKFDNKNVLITGINGFLPSYLFYTLLYLVDKKNMNINIYGLSRNKTKTEMRYRWCMHMNHVHFIYQDVVTPINVDVRFDYVIHAASQASPKFYNIDPVGTILPNVIATYHLLQKAVSDKTQRILYFSSGEVYGETSNVPTKEDDFGKIDPCTVRACYSESKRAGETLCKAFHHQYGLETLVVRPFHTYGPGVDLNDGRVFADFVKNILDKQDIQITSDGSAKRAFCYLADATVGFFTVLLNGIPGQAYNIGNPHEEISILNLAEKLITLFPEFGLKVERIAPKSTSSYLKSSIDRNSPNINKAMELGWVPTTTIQEGFKKMVTSYLQKSTVL